MSGPRLWHRQQAGAGRRAAALEPGSRRDRVDRDHRDRGVLRLHQAHPVQTRLPPERRVRERAQHPAQIAGAHRGRQRRPGQRDPARRQHRPRDDGNRIARAADPRRRDRQDPPAPVPGRQLVRRTAARQPLREDGLLGLHDPDRADRRPGPARPGARRAQHRHAREPAELPDQLRRSAHAQAGRRRKRRTGTGSARPERGAKRSTRPTPAGPSRCAAARSTRRRSPAPNRTTSRNWSRRSAR